MAITFPNATKAVGSSVSSVTTSGVTTTTGSTFLISCSRGVGVTATPSDSKGNTYTQIAALSNNSALTVWYCSNGTGGAGHTATITLGAADYPVLHFVELAGAATASYDSGALATNNDAQTITSGTLAQADSAVVSWIASNSGGAQNYAATGYTVARETDGDNYWTSAVGYKAVSSTTAQGITWTGVGGTTPIVIAAFKAAAIGGGITCTLAVTDTADTVASTATVAVAASLASADTADTLAATANVAVVASLGVTDAADSLASTAAVRVTANASATDAADSLSSTAVVGNPPVTCDLAVTDAADSLAATAAALVVASLAATDAGDTLSAAAQAAVVAALAVSDASDTLSAVAVTSGPVTANLAVTDQDDVLDAVLRTSEQTGAGDYEKRKRRKLIEELNRQILAEQAEEQPEEVVVVAKAQPAKAKKKVVQVVNKGGQDDEDEFEALMLLM